jgi:hypothetical protein
MDHLKDGLPPAVRRLLRLGYGSFTVRDARDAGVSEYDVRALAKQRRLTRVARGTYASTSELECADPWAAHAIRARAFVKGCRNDVIVAGWSAVAVRRLRHLGKPPELPTVIRPCLTSVSGTSNTEYGVIRQCNVPEAYRGQYAGCPVLRPAWLAMDLARFAERAGALVVADAVLADGATAVGLTRAVASMPRWPGIESAAWVAEHADGRSESVLESLGRLCCLEHALPVPVSNAWVGNGRPEYRVDHLWPNHGVVAEADGALKYRDVADPAAVVAEEKERQWYLERELGLTVVRYGWDLAFRDREQLAGRFRAVLNASSTRRARVTWWPIYDPIG